MNSLFKKIFVFFAVLQLIAVQVRAETVSHVAYASGWTGNGIAGELNKKLKQTQEQAFR